MPRGHKPDCGCAPCRAARQGDINRLEAERHELAAERARLEQAASKYRAAVRFVMGAMAMLTSQPASDAVASVASRLRGTPLDFSVAEVLDAAGVHAAGPADSWGAEAGRQASSQSAVKAMFAASPEHDPRVTQAILAGASDAEVSRLLAEVVQEYGERQAERKARQVPGVLWNTRSGPLMESGWAPVGVSLGPDGAPRQRSVTHADVAPLGAEEV
jgi:hypothetical protein